MQQSGSDFLFRARLFEPRERRFEQSRATRRRPVAAAIAPRRRKRPTFAQRVTERRKQGLRLRSELVAARESVTQYSRWLAREQGFSAECR